MTTPSEVADFDDPVVAATWVASRLGPVFPVDHPHLAICAGLHGPRTPCDKKRGKHPAAKWSRDVSSDPAAVAKMFAGAPRNVGLACGPAGLLVVDEDDPGAFAAYAASVGETLPTTFTVSTGRGTHYYFRQDGTFGNSEGRLTGRKINVRGVGGFVVAPWSLHASGSRYLPDHPDADVVDLPPWLARALRSSVDGGESDATGALAGATAAVDPDVVASAEEPWPAIASDRHNAFVRYAGDLLQRAVPLHEAEVLMARLWRGAMQPADDPYPVDAALADLRDVYRRYGNAGGPFSAAVAAEAERLRVREQASALVRQERAGALQLPSLTTLSSFLLVPDEPAVYRVADLWPVGGRIVLSAPYKAGKTTLRENLVRALVDAEPFLSTFRVEAFDGSVVVVDDELDERTLRRWMREQRIVNTDRVQVLSLRGQVSSFNILDAAVRAQWAAAIREVSGAIVILDCLRPVLDALGLSEDKEAGRFLVAFDQLLAEAGASEGVIVHHMGHSGERSRGDTRLRDWPDAEWQLHRRQAAEDTPERRYFRAYGRDVDVPEGLLTYDAHTRRLSFEGGSRRDDAADDVIPDLLEQLKKKRGSSQRDILEALRNHRRADVLAAISKAQSRGLLYRKDGPRNSTLHYATNDPNNWAQRLGMTAPSAPGLRQRTADECASAPIEGAHSTLQRRTLSHGALAWVPTRMPSRSLVGAASRGPTRSTGRSIRGRPIEEPPLSRTSWDSRARAS